VRHAGAVLVVSLRGEVVVLFHDGWWRLAVHADVNGRNRSAQRLSWCARSRGVQTGARTVLYGGFEGSRTCTGEDSEGEK
jgi:hypothetical protein